MRNFADIAAKIAFATGCVVWGDILTAAIAYVVLKLSGKRLDVKLTDKPSNNFHVVKLEKESDNGG